MVKKFWSFGVSFVSQTLRLFLQLSGKLGNLGSQWKCWPNLRQTALCRPYPSAISGSLCCEEWVSPRFYMEDCLHTNWISCFFFLLLASGSDSVQGSGSLTHTQSYAQVGHFFFKRLPWIIQPEMIVVLYPAESSRKYSLTCLRNALRFSLILIRRINAKCISRLQCTLWDGKSLSTKSRFHQENYSRGWGSFPHPPTQSELSQTILILKLSVASYGKKKKSYLGKYHSKALVNLY